MFSHTIILHVARRIKQSYILDICLNVIIDLSANNIIISIFISQLIYA